MIGYNQTESGYNRQKYQRKTVNSEKMSGRQNAVKQPCKDKTNGKHHKTYQPIRYQDVYKRQVTFNVSIVPDDLILYADENLISQVIINLLKNAIQAFETGAPAATGTNAETTAETNAATTEKHINIRAYCCLLYTSRCV